MEQELRVTVTGELAGERADKALAVLAGVSRAEAKELIFAERALLNGEPVSPRRPVAEGDTLSYRPLPASPVLEPEDVPFRIRYEDDAVMVVDKPAGIVTLPGAGNRRGTLASGLVARRPFLAGVGEPGRAGLVHRLDKDTSGLLLVAKRNDVLALLQRHLRSRHISRVYLALVGGTFTVPTGTIDAPIGRDPARPVAFTVTGGGRPARTHYRVLRAWEHATLLEVRLETGRTHQIRVHLDAIGHPVAGDPSYGRGKRRPEAPRLWLHAARLEFPDVLGDRRITVESPLPVDLEAVLAALDEPG